MGVGLDVGVPVGVTTTVYGCDLQAHLSSQDM